MAVMTSETAMMSELLYGSLNIRVATSAHIQYIADRFSSCFTISKMAMKFTVMVCTYYIPYELYVPYCRHYR
jgi:hypothetical protein